MLRTSGGREWMWAMLGACVWASGCAVDGLCSERALLAVSEGRLSI